MNHDKTAQFILKLRKDNNLTQAEFADMFGVTYQAVSKWENGKNIPDILILKEICKKFNVDINEILDGEKIKIHSKKRFYQSMIALGILLLLLGGFLYIYTEMNRENFHFKTITTDCDNFTIFGSMAYNRNQSHLYISRIEYCGGNGSTEFTKIECGLYKMVNNVSTRLDSRIVNEAGGIRLEDFLQDVRFHVDDFGATCPDFHEAELFLQIFATDKENQVRSYRISLNAQATCPNN